MGLSELVLCVAALVVGKFQLGFGIDDPEDARLRRHRVRQPGDDLHESSTPAPVVDRAEPLAGALVGGRSC